jgi:hypothetical protein
MHRRWLQAVTGLAGPALVALTVLGLCLTAASARAADGEQGFKSLFDGKTLTGWEGNPDNWRVEDGVITGDTSGHPIKPNSFLIWRQGEVDDFELRVDYRFQSEWGNSGVQFRSFEVPDAKWAVGGYQADCETGASHSGGLYGERYRGILARRGQKVVIGDDHKSKIVELFGDVAKMQEFVKPTNEWNSYRIVARGYHITQELNGHLMIDLTDQDSAVRRRSGIIALQLHAGKPMRVQFRNILLKRLKMEDTKKVVFIAGRPSHGYAQHEHHAGCLLLARLLNKNVPGLFATVYRILPGKGPEGNWPQDPTALDNADTVVFFCDGGKNHPAIGHLDELDKLTKKGVGVACIHYAVEVPKGQPGDAFLNWIGGYFETFWSTNPNWTAVYKGFPDHPISRGVKPFTIEDEWYYHMRFREDMKGVTPILSAIPPESTRQGKDGPYSGNPAIRARKGMAEVTAWALQRPDGSRGFGFTGAHWHWNWGNDSFRTTVLNAIVWVAGLEVPPGGVKSKTPTLEELMANLDSKPSRGFDKAKIQKMLDSWKPQQTAAK